MPAPIFDRTALKIKPLCQRTHDLSRDVVLDLETPASFEHQEVLQSVAENIVRAKKEGSSVVMMMGGHVIRSACKSILSI